jgi:hypothetical protein
METCSGSAHLINPRNSGIRRVRDSPACTDGEPTTGRRKSNAFYCLIEE